jgi:hypothetical protein
MELKWFFVAIGMFLTFAILTGMYFISLYVAENTNQNTELELNKSSSNFNESLLIHDALYNNITDLKKGLDPIIAIIPNATQTELERQIHFNQTAADFDKIQNILEIKLEDHITVGQVNATVNEILVILKGENTTTASSSTVPCNNETSVPIENITGQEILVNKLPQNC